MKRKDNLLKAKPGISFEVFRLPVFRNPAVPVYIQEEFKKKFPIYSDRSRVLRKKERNFYGIKTEFDLLRKFPNINSAHLKTIEETKKTLFEIARSKKVIKKYTEFHMKWYSGLFLEWMEEILEDNR